MSTVLFVLELLLAVVIVNCAIGDNFFYFLLQCTILSLREANIT